MREEKTSMTDKEFQLLNKYAKEKGVTKEEAFLDAFLESIKDRFQSNSEGVVRLFLDY